MLAVELWGGFLIALGAGLLVFNKPYARWALQVVPWPFSRFGLVFSRVMTVALAVVLILAGLSAFGIGPGHK